MISKLGHHFSHAFSFTSSFGRCGSAFGVKKYTAQTLRNCMPHYSNPMRNKMAFIKDPIGFSIGRQLGSLFQGQVKLPNSVSNFMSHIPMLQGFLSAAGRNQSACGYNSINNQQIQNIFQMPTTPTAKDSARTLEAGINEQGKLAVSTADGYQISCSDSKQEWFITSPDGKSTRIWGDPHVVESDGDKWDFKDQSSFIFGDNKVTVKTTPAGNGTTYSSEITIYNGNDRVTIGGIDNGNPTIIGMGHDGRAHDFTTADGNRYYLAKEANGDDAWIK